MSPVSEKQPAQSALGVREAQRLETRTRIFDAAVEEISRSGMADADVSSIVAAAGVARGTFYFHFPTKEHVVAELVCAEEARIVAKLGSPEVRAKDLSALTPRVANVERFFAAAQRTVGYPDAVPIDTTPCAFSPSISASEYPASRSTSVVCCPWTGGASRTSPGVADSFTGRPSSRIRPAVGCSISSTIPRWRTCGWSSA